MRKFELFDFHMENKSKEINRKKIEWLLTQPIDMQLEIVSHYMDICRIMINFLLDQKVCDYTGQRYRHNKPHDSRYSHWGFGIAIPLGQSGQCKIGRSENTD